MLNWSREYVYLWYANLEICMLDRGPFGALVARQEPIFSYFWPQNRFFHRISLRIGPFSIQWSFDMTQKNVVIQNSLKAQHRIIPYPESSKVRERASEQMSATELASKTISAEQANEQALRVNWLASGPALTLGFLTVLDHPYLPSFTPTHEVQLPPTKHHSYL